jgi:hypothetical protein
LVETPGDHNRRPREAHQLVSFEVGSLAARQQEDPSLLQ